MIFENHVRFFMHYFDLFNALVFVVDDDVDNVVFRQAG